MNEPKHCTQCGTKRIIFDYLGKKPVNNSYYRNVDGYSLTCQKCDYKGEVTVEERD